MDKKKGGRFSLTRWMSGSSSFTSYSSFHPHCNKRPLYFIQQDYKREGKKEYESDREGSGTPSEDMTSSPCAQHNGSYKTHGEEDVILGRNARKWDTTRSRLPPSSISHPSPHQWVSSVSHCELLEQPQGFWCWARFPAGRIGVTVAVGEMRLTPFGSS